MSKLITRIRACVRSLNYAVSFHAAEEIEDDDLTILDVENIILTGAIVTRQRDRKTNEQKLLVRGFCTQGGEAEAVVKVRAAGSLFIITVYRV